MKKILILSRASDVSTSDVIEWLIYNKAKVDRINIEDRLFNCRVSFKSHRNILIELEFERNILISLKDYSSFWYRRGELLFWKPEVEQYQNQVNRLLKNEWKVLTDFIYSFLEKRPHLGSLNKERNHNKLLSLLHAASVGLKIPHTVITTEKHDAVKSIKQNEYITKAIHNIFTIHYDGLFSAVGTRLVSDYDLKSLGYYFFPTLFQKNIEKEYELRIFFIKNKFFPMAIFSSFDEQTKIDFRNYNRSKPNRCVPFILPDGIETKLKNFIKVMELDTGSIDMIVTKEYKFIFIEVNHIGQFGWLSDNCNYCIEKEIADYLISICR
ncbi:MAG: grasp-with-spasm system ATP-grasp peptide maturase [Saprospiraceae bacterium]